MNSMIIVRNSDPSSLYVSVVKCLTLYIFIKKRESYHLESYVLFNVPNVIFQAIYDLVKK